MRVRTGAASDALVSADQALAGIRRLVGPRIVTVAQMRALEAAAIAAGTPERELQRRAARAIAELAQSFDPGAGARLVTVLVGPGNNGRDAMLLQAGLLARMPASRQSALETWVARVPADHARASLAAAQRTQLLIDQNVNPRLAMEVMLLDLRVRRPA